MAAFQRSSHKNFVCIYLCYLNDLTGASQSNTSLSHKSWCLLTCPRTKTRFDKLMLCSANVSDFYTGGCLNIYELLVVKTGASWMQNSIKLKGSSSKQLTFKTIQKLHLWWYRKACGQLQNGRAAVYLRNKNSVSWICTSWTATVSSICKFVALAITHVSRTGIFLHQSNWISHHVSRILFRYLLRF